MSRDSTLAHREAFIFRLRSIGTTRIQSMWPVIGRNFPPLPFPVSTSSGRVTSLDAHIETVEIVRGADEIKDAAGW